MSPRVRNVLNFILFQAGWLLCVLYPGRPAAFGAMALVALHLAVISRHRLAEAQFIGLGVVAGASLDTLWLNTGVLSAPTGALGVAPPWLVGLWAMFMTTVCHSLSWMDDRRWLPFLLAPIAGPFAYWSAAELGAVTLDQGALSLAALALGWLVLFPLLLWVRRTIYTELCHDPA